jgi:hypothetical protein
MKVCQQPFTLLSPHYCDVNVAAKERMQSEIERLLEADSQSSQSKLLGLCHVSIFLL